MSQCPQHPSDCRSVNRCTALRARPLRIMNLVRAGTVLQWSLKDLGLTAEQMTGGLEITPQYGRHGVDQDDQWTDLSDEPVLGGFFEVLGQIPRGSNHSIYFRLKVQNGNQQQFTTLPQHAHEIIPLKMQELYQACLRRWGEKSSREFLRTGVLLKRIRWGFECPDCRDRDGHHQIKTQCPTCLDTGYPPGYVAYGGCFNLEFSPTRLDDKFDFGSGFTQDGPIGQAVFLNIPELHPGDCWVDLDTDERWLFGSPMETSVRIGGQDVIRKAPLVRLDTTHVVHRFQISKG
jgi:hypothetical protein